MIDFFKIFQKVFFSKSKSRYSITSQTENNIKKDWETIQLLLSQKGPSQLKQALITADKTLDSALRDIYPGNSLGERLKAGQSRFNSNLYNRLWEAHKIRNNLVHESNYEPPHYVLTKSVQDLKEGLKALRVNI